MRLKLSVFFIVLLFGLSKTSIITGFDIPQSFTLTVKPINIQFQASYSPDLIKQKNIRIRSISPTGKAYQVRDVKGQGQWSIETNAKDQLLQITPSKDTYAGPIEVLVGNKVVPHFQDHVQNLNQHVIEKVLSSKAADGMEFKVHFTDYAIQKANDPQYPYRILEKMHQSYEILKKEIDLENDNYKIPNSIDVYIGRGDDSSLGLGGFSVEQFKRAPIFVVRDNEVSGEKETAILMPANYKRFLDFWKKINHVSHDKEYDVDEYLATSIIHEMTHVFIYQINENLGSTEYQVRNGDWYTEGLARYYETKIGSDAGFCSAGFRHYSDDKIQFSRGGANYYLRYPDETFFGLRYENSLFWLYFDKRFGTQKIQEVTEELNKLPFNADRAMYIRTLDKVLQMPFLEILDDYFNWIYSEGYKGFKAGENLLPVARTKSIWSQGYFHLYTKDRNLIKKESTLKTDWIAHWGDFEAENLEDVKAGDLTQWSDIKPLSFDVHEILLSKSSPDNQVMILKNVGAAQLLKATVYMDTGIEKKVRHFELDKDSWVEFEIEGDSNLISLGVVFSNLDSSNTARYEIEVV